MSIISVRETTANHWNVNEAERLVVPGVSAFNKDGIRKIINSAENSQHQTLNISLILNKYPWWSSCEQFIAFQPNISRPKLNKHQKPTGKTETLDRHYDLELFEAISKLSKSPPEHYSQILDRHTMAADRETVVTIDMETITRLLIGLSAKNVFETGITLHPWYGFPYLPGSSVKGAFLHYCNDFETGVADPDIFGTQKKQGAITFCDAWPVPWTNQQLITRDIMTPHYGKYYRGEALPADNDSPNPISILAVKEGIKFRFCLRAKTGSCVVLNQAKALLKKSLTTAGVGAKTGSSYGYFKEART